MKKDVIIACDFSNSEETLSFLNKFNDLKSADGDKSFVKIGMELFYSEGPDMVRKIKDMGHKIFLDLKLHDIPNTVKKAMSSLSKLNIDMVNLHAAGGREMMEAGLEGLTRSDGSRPLLIAVTQLTSTNQKQLNEDILIPLKLEETVLRYAETAHACGLDGVVSSPLESTAIHNLLGENFLTVTPGIRFADSKKDDQKRITTPAEAKRLGSSFIVVGRPITKSEDPVQSYIRCMHEFADIDL